MSTSAPSFAAIPSVDRLMQQQPVADLAARHGRPAVTDAARLVLDDLRGRVAAGGEVPDLATLAAALSDRLATDFAPSLVRVFNLTGTILHTNLGRAPLPQEAIDAMVAVAGAPANLEFDLASGRRGDRDSHLEDWIVRLTGAEAATVVNNNAAAVLLVLNSLAHGKEVPVSRGELIEIGGAFRMPDIMARAECRLREVGTTNRTHMKDFETAIGADTALLMKVHTSNYVVRGFTAMPAERDVAALAHAHDIPFVVDLGSGTLVDLTQYGLPHEPTVRETLDQGADLVTFSGDKLLGGPQAGLIAGRADLIAELKSNPLKRAMRIDKVTTAALGAVLKLYADPDRLADRLPALGLMTRPLDTVESDAGQVADALTARLGQAFTITVEPCKSQIGSGALPVESLPSLAVVLRPAGAKAKGRRLNALAVQLRQLPIPVIGHIHDDALRLDMRGLDDCPLFLDQLGALHWSDVP